MNDPTNIRILVESTDVDVTSSSSSSLKGMNDSLSLILMTEEIKQLLNTFRSIFSLFMKLYANRLTTSNDSKGKNPSITNSVEPRQNSNSSDQGI